MSERRWYCMECHTDLGPVVGKHKGTCPSCGSKSAYAAVRGSGELKPCPFCGGEATMFCDESTDTWNVLCDNVPCPAEPGTAICFSEQEAIDAWNTRAVEVVRCRDCKHANHDPEWQPDRRFKPVDMWTCHAEWCEGFEGDHPQVEPDGFCKWGERK